jgi:hypothetical protein
MIKITPSVFGQMIQGIRRILWSLIVAYMLGMHNFYYGDNKTRDDSIITVEVKEDQKSGAPKD